MSRLRRQPRQARARQRVDAILDAAAQLLSESGVGGLNTNAIAARAGVPVGSVYQYFANKEDIVHQLALRSLTRMDEVLDEVLVPGPDWEELIERVIDALDTLYREEPGFLTVWGHHGSAALAEADREHDAHLAARLEPLLAAVAPHLKPALRRTVCALVVHITGPVFSLSQRQAPRARRRLIEETKRLLKAYLREHIEGAG